VELYSLAKNATSITEQEILFQLLVILLPKWPCLQPVSQPSKTKFSIAFDFKRIQG